MQKISKDTFWSSGSKMQAHQLIACRVHAHNLRPMHALIDFSAIQTPAQPGDASAALRVAFGAPCEVLKTHELHQVKAVLEAVEQRARAGQWCVGYVCYEAAPAFDAALTVHPATGPLVWFGVHDAPLPGDPALQKADPLLSSATTTPRVAWQPGLARTAFDAALELLHRAIADGEIYQANFTARTLGQLNVSPDELFAAMRQAQPGGFAAYLDTGEEQVLSVSPELFFDWHNGHLVTRPMKGTAPRGRSPQEDLALADALQSSPKERAENVMIVDLIRNDLSRIAQPFSVKVDGLCRVQALPTVWQMVSDVHADTRPGTTLVDVFGALFPCGSITGAPKVQAMRWIRELEHSARGVYCGAVGVVRPGGSATFNVPIRTAVVRGNTICAGTGSGITFDATPEAEWQEWRHKQAFMQRASQSFELLETLALRDGVLQHGDHHLERMKASAAHFGYVWPQGAVHDTLAQLTMQHPRGAWRVRLLLGVGGQLQAQAFELPDTATCVNLNLATSPLEEADGEFVRHKTTRRAHYERFAPTDPGVFDTVLWNTRGELTECTRGNLALLLDDRWVTPALGSGLLPGVGRAHWLGQGRMVEAVVTLGDLPRVQALAFINSLRGWVDAKLASSVRTTPVY
jgi:para-aminobenzoate synthetase/4-amino-4-deoxychorismate lyase